MWRRDPYAPRSPRGGCWRQLRSVAILVAAVGLAYYLSGPHGEWTRGATVHVADPWRVRVVDGDTFHYGDETIRIAGIDAPEINPPHCPEEAALGERAKIRLGTLLAVGAFDMVPDRRDTDEYGRKLRDVVRNGQSIGGALVAEGLARRYEGKRKPWCARATVGPAAPQAPAGYARGAS